LKPIFDKVLLKFFADVLYLKGLLYEEELEDILNVCTFSDLDNICEKMFNEEYSPYRKPGENYVQIKVKKLLKGSGEYYRRHERRGDGGTGASNNTFAT